MSECIRDILLYYSEIDLFEGSGKNTHIGEEEKEFYINLAPSIEKDFDIGGGISGIVSPFGEFETPPIINEEGIVYGHINLEKIIEAKHMVDSVGHYARSDVTQLIFNAEKNTALNLSNQPNIIKYKNNK